VVHAADRRSLPSSHRSSLERVGLRIKNVVTPDSEPTPPRRATVELDYFAEEVESIQVGADRNTAFFEEIPLYVRLAPTKASPPVSTSSTA
jgi:hypothetical protein